MPDKAAGGPRELRGLVEGPDFLKSPFELQHWRFLGSCKLLNTDLSFLYPWGITALGTNPAETMM